MPAGRPTDYSGETCNSVCMLIAEGLSLRKICAMDSMPDKATIFRWLAIHQEFRDQYAKAKEQGALVWAEEILEIADDASNDYMEQLDDEGKAAAWKFMGENVQRSRLRVDSRKWLLSKLLPKKYGDKIQTEHSGAVEITKIERTIVNAKDSNS